jgi:hypothetical protein
MTDEQFKILAGGINRNFEETAAVHADLRKLMDKPAQVSDYWKNLKARVEATFDAVTSAP